jgi:hypothetical protein
MRRAGRVAIGGPDKSDVLPLRWVTFQKCGSSCTVGKCSGIIFQPIISDTWSVRCSVSRLIGAAWQLSYLRLFWGRKAAGQWEERINHFCSGALLNQLILWNYKPPSTKVWFIVLAAMKASANFMFLTAFVRGIYILRLVADDVWDRSLAASRAFSNWLEQEEIFFTPYLQIHVFLSSFYGHPGSL